MIDLNVCPSILCKFPSSWILNSHVDMNHPKIIIAFLVIKCWKTLLAPILEIFQINLSNSAICRHEWLFRYKVLTLWASVFLRNHRSWDYPCWRTNNDESSFLNIHKLLENEQEAIIESTKSYPYGLYVSVSAECYIPHQTLMQPESQ